MPSLFSPLQEAALQAELGAAQEALDELQNGGCAAAEEALPD